MIIPNRYNPQSGAKAAIATDQENNNFARRAASALILAPIAIAAAALGGWAFIIALRDRGRACSLGMEFFGHPPRRFAHSCARIGGATCRGGAHPRNGLPAAAVAALAIGALIAGATVAAVPRAYAEETSPLWAATGAVYAGIRVYRTGRPARRPRKGVRGSAVSVRDRMGHRHLGLSWPDARWAVRSCGRNSVPRKPGRAPLAASAGVIAAGAPRCLCDAGTKPLGRGRSSLILVDCGARWRSPRILGETALRR